MTKIIIKRIYNLEHSEICYEFKFEGHSGYDVIGKDIVCASITTCVELLKRYADKLEGSYTTKDGYAKIELKHTLKYIYIETMIDYLQDLALSYPKNVSISVLYLYE